MAGFWVRWGRAVVREGKAEVSCGKSFDDEDTFGRSVGEADDVVLAPDGDAESLLPAVFAGVGRFDDCVAVEVS